MSSPVIGVLPAAGKHSGASRLLQRTATALLAGVSLGVMSAHATDGTWTGPGALWVTGTNWSSSPTVPDNTATFTNNGAPTSLTLTGSNSINTMLFDAAAPAYTFTLSLTSFNILGTGIVNNSAFAPSLVTSGGSAISFRNSSTAGNAIIIDIAAFGSSLSFLNSSTAGNATIINGAFNSVQFFNTSTAGNAQLIALGGSFNFSTTTGLLNDNKITAGSIAGAGSYALGSNTLTVGGNNLSTEVSGVISGAGGALTKVGTGTLTLSGTDTYSGATTVSGGRLSVNGSILASSLTTVNAGGTLGGNGIVGNTIINGGALAPGNSIGTLAVQGNLAFASAASYMVEVSAVSADRTNVTGTATLAGTVQVTSPAGSYRFNSPYTILTSAGLNGTQFNALTTPTGIAGSLIYSGSNVLLNLTSGLGQLPGLNINQRAVGAALDVALNGQGSASGAIGGIFSGNVAQNLTQASGETATGSQQSTFDAMGQFIGLLADPFIAGRGAPVTSSTGAPAYAEESDGANAYASSGRKRSGAERDAYAMFTKAPLAQSYDPRWSVWGAGFGGSQTTDGNATLGSNTATSRLGAVAVGADYRFSPYTLAGFALAGGGTSFSVANGGSGRSDLFQAGAFVRHAVGPVYVSAALAYGWQDITTDRTVTIAGIDQLRARFNANAFSGRVEGGYRFVSPWMGVGITPYAAGQFTTFELPNYAEGVVSGANTFALAYAAKSVTDARSELGLRSDKSYAMVGAILTLRGRAAWAHDFNTDRTIGATFQALPGASFVVNGAAQSHDKALTTASAEVKWLSGFSLAAAFEGEFSDVSRSYAGKGVARYSW